MSIPLLPEFDADGYQVEPSTEKVNEIITALNAAGSGGGATILTATDYNLTADQSGSVFVLNRAGGIDVNVPETTIADVGTVYEFHIQTAISTGSYTILSDSWNATFSGRILHYDTDTSNALNVYTGAPATFTALAIGATAGGGVGGWLKLILVAANAWIVTGTLFGTGAPETPFYVLE